MRCKRSLKSLENRNVWNFGALIPLIQIFEVFITGTGHTCNADGEKLLKIDMILNVHFVG
jgi:hypothetical protein